MSKYKITIEGTRNNNPEYDPDESLKRGMDVDGFLLLTFKNGNPHSTSLMGCTTLEIARLFAGDKSEAGSVIRQAMAIAEGILKAEEIKKTEDRNTMARSLAEMLRATK